MSAPSVILTTRDGRQIDASAVKDGNLYGIELTSGRIIYKIAVTKLLNADTPLEVGISTRFCPSTRDGVEWNGPAYNSATNSI